MPALSFADHPELQLVDTTGAGDTYTAAFAVALCELFLLQTQTSNQQGEQPVVTSSATVTEVYQNYNELAQCMRFASQAAFLCISKFGACPAIPNRIEVSNLANNHHDHH